MVRLVTMTEVAVDADRTNVVHVFTVPVLLEYFTRYSVIGEPPVLAGVAHETARLALPRTATTAVGILGTVAGVAGAEFADGRLKPTEF